jgi:hypothetical protein
VACGNAKRTYDEACDDGIPLHFMNNSLEGNLADGDGCSSNCTTEKGFQCFGGSYSTPDVCIKGIILSFSRDTSENVSTTATPIAPNVASPASPTVAIAVGTVGGVILLAAAAVIVFLVRRKTRSIDLGSTPIVAELELQEEIGRGAFGVVYKGDATVLLVLILE